MMLAAYLAFKYIFFCEMSALSLLPSGCRILSYVLETSASQRCALRTFPPSIAVQHSLSPAQRSLWGTWMGSWVVHTQPGIPTRTSGFSLQHSSSLAHSFSTKSPPFISNSTWLSLLSHCYAPPLCTGEEILWDRLWSHFTGKKNK